ncbi:MAG: DUF2920 family protein, partial [Deferribacteraceae bacterium]|nr:DUF2920 family protein [Deferribacteraceae bacterium]
IEIYIKEPDSGVNANTGLFLIVFAVGGHAASAYYVKLREEWANRYNVVTLGVNILGTKARIHNETNLELQDGEKAIPFIMDLVQKRNPEGLSELKKQQPQCTFGDLLQLLSNINLARHIKVLNKNPIPRDEIRDYRDYRDYGYIQTMDCLYGVKYVLDRYKLNSKRIFAFGSSLGAYIAHMCAKFAPNTFSLIADNSGWAAVDEYTVFTERYPVGYNIGNMVEVALAVEQYYSEDRNSPYYFSEDMFKIRALNDDSHLNIFKRHFKGRIVMFHQKNDRLVNYQTRLALAEKYLKNGINATLHSFGAEDIDGVIIKSDKHGMNADLKLLFEKYCDNYALEENQDKLAACIGTDFDMGHKLVYPAKRCNYIIDYSGNYPTIESKKIGGRK